MRCLMLPAALLTCELLWRNASVGYHGTELEHHKLPPVPADTHLAEDDWPARLDCNHHCHNQERQAKDSQQDKREENIETALKNRHVDHAPCITAFGKFQKCEPS